MKPTYTIPTEQKCKIPRTFSYPVGSERLSEVLHDVPQIKELSISFPHFDCAKHLREATKLHPVLEVRYSHSRPGLSSSNAMIEGGWYLPKWQIHVRPVMRGLKHTVAALLLSEGLQHVRTWLFNNKALSGKEAFRRITLLYDELAGMFRFEEYSGA